MNVPFSIELTWMKPSAPLIVATIIVLAFLSQYQMAQQGENAWGIKYYGSDSLVVITLSGTTFTYIAEPVFQGRLEVTQTHIITTSFTRGPLGEEPTALVDVVVRAYSPSSGEHQYIVTGYLKTLDGDTISGEPIALTFNPLGALIGPREVEVTTNENGFFDWDWRGNTDSVLTQIVYLGSEKYLPCRFSEYRTIFLSRPDELPNYLSTVPTEEVAISTGNGFTVIQPVWIWLLIISIGLLLTSLVLYEREKH